VTDQAARLRRAVELAVYAPVGVAVTLRDLGPTIVNLLVARGRAEVNRREEQVHGTIRHAKSAGDVAVVFRLPMLADRVRDAAQRAIELDPRVRDRDAIDVDVAHDEPVHDELVHDALDLEVDDAVGHLAAARPAVANGVHHTAPAANGSGNGNGVGAATLAIPGYDALSASQVVERLDGLDAAELQAVRAYESAHRNRRTILGKIDQLAT
jgi:hypothetical protein